MKIQQKLVLARFLSESLPISTRKPFETGQLDRMRKMQT